MMRRIISAYVRNTTISGLLFLPLAIFSDRAWTTEDTISFFTLGWLLGWMISAIVMAGSRTIDDKENKE